MHRGIRLLFMGLVSIAIGVRCQAQPANPWEGEMPFDAVARLRPASSFEAGLIEEGLCRSVTLRSLVATLKTSDLIVYVNVKRLLSGSLAGGLQFVAATATSRIIRVVIGLTVDRAARIALLGHELQHAVEVAGAPHIRSSAALADYYRSHGVPGATQHAYETEAARLTEARIRTEAAESMPACVVPRSRSAVELTPSHIGRLTSAQKEIVDDQASALRRHDDNCRTPMDAGVTRSRHSKRV
jgi:hypothetical protein